MVHVMVHQNRTKHTDYMASIKQRSNTWYAVWYQDGKTIVKSTGVKCTSAKNKRLAQNTADAMEAASKSCASLDKALDAVRATAELTGISGRMPSIREYMMEHMPKGTSSHKKNVRRAIGVFLDFLGPSAIRRLDSLSVKQCKEFIETQMQRISYGTAKNYKGYIAYALRDALDEHLLLRNPMESVRMSSIETDADQRAIKRLPFTREELNIIFTQFPSPWRELAMTSFLTGGQRMGDICLLKWESIDFIRNRIHFRTMKTGKEIVAPIIPELRDLLVKHQNDSEYVFPSMAQKYHRSPGSLSTNFSALLKTFGIIEDTPSVTKYERRTIARKSFHSLRHSVVSMMRTDNRFTADLTREIVGHDSEDIERGYYTADDESKRNALAFLAEEVKIG